MARSDAKLIAALRAGSEQAAGELVRRHWRSSYRAAYAIVRRRESAEDIVQDAFERAFRRLGDFDAERPFAPWLHRIVVNRAIDVLKQDRHDAGLLDENLIDRKRDRRESDAELLEGLGALTLERRAVVVMRYLLGYSPPEIAELLELPLGTVNSRLARGLQELRTILGER